jgi:tetratricopeptide (TPR) repeat protein
MSQPGANVKKRTSGTQKRQKLEARPGSSIQITRRQAGFALNALAMTYAFLAGFHTFFDLDLGWHMATARYVLQHHTIPTTDILSYTSPGATWIYPPFAGILFYLIHQLAGYAGLTWFCAAALMAVVACLLEGPSHVECYATAVLATLAVPTLAPRFTPRPDLFTHLFFAIFFVQLWRFHRSDENSAVHKRWRFRLWILPILMVLWVNAHPGFIVGVGAVLAYVLIEGLDLLIPANRSAAIQRLKLAWLPLLATPVATLLNPFGLKIYASALSLSGYAAAGQIKSAFTVYELQTVRVTLPSMALALDWRNPDSSFWWLTLIALAALGIALFKRQFGSAVILALVLVAGVQRLRYEGLFATVVVVVASGSLTVALARRYESGFEGSAHERLSWFHGLLACSLMLLVSVRAADLISSRSNISNGRNQAFGAGQSSWFPERAVDFILREHLKGNLFEEYNLGGFAAWRLGSVYPVYIDGRGVSPKVINEYTNVVLTQPDSPAWEEEVVRRGINIVFFSLARYPGSLEPYLRGFCEGRLFRPVYMDELSIVLLRDVPENRPWIERLHVDCKAHEFAPAADSSRAALADFYANIGTIELNLGQENEAQLALEHSQALVSEDLTVHLALAQIFFDRQQPSDCERELKTAVSLRTGQDEPWRRLARFYLFYHRFEDARPAVWRASQLSTQPADDYNLLGWIDMNLHEDKRALADFDQAEKAAAVYRGQEDDHRELFGGIAAGRASVFAAERDWKAAIQYQQEATRQMPGNVRQWQALGDMFQAAGELQLAEQAREKARLLNGGS